MSSTVESTSVIVSSTVESTVSPTVEGEFPS